MRDAGTPQGVRHEILSVGPSCADNIIPCTSLRSWSLRSSAASPKHAISSDGHIPTGSASLILVAVDDSVTRQTVGYLCAPPVEPA